jgi:hypothetical protein
VVDFELGLLALAVLGLLLGIWAIIWSRSSRGRAKGTWAWTLFLGTQLFLGGSSLVAAFHRAEGLVPLGLAAGLLTTGMLWEAPIDRGQQD